MLTTHSDLKAVITDLMKEERVEKGMIELYQGLIEAGVAECLPGKSRQEKFSQLVRVLYDESVEHQKLIFGLIAKYQDL